MIVSRAFPLIHHASLNGPKRSDVLVRNPVKFLLRSHPMLDEIGHFALILAVPIAAAASTLAMVEA